MKRVASTSAALLAALVAVGGGAAGAATPPDAPADGATDEIGGGDRGALPGPLRLRDGFLLHSAFLLPTPPPVELLPAGGRQVDFELTVANTFTRSNFVQLALEAREQREAVDPEFFRRIETENPFAERLFLLDGEVRRGELRFRQGLGRGLEVELSVPVLDVQGGQLDRLAEGFHSLLGIDQDGRDAVVRGAYLVYLDLADGLLLRDEAPGTSFGDAVLTVRKAYGKTLGRGPRRRAPPANLMFEGSLKLPTGDETHLLSSGSVDIGVQGMIWGCGRYFCAYGGLGVRRLGAWRVLGLGEQTVLDGVTAIERRFAGGMSLIYQIGAAQSPLSDLGLANLRKDSYRFSFGVKHRFDRQRNLVLAVTENFAHFDNGSDITFHFGWTQTLAGGSLWRSD